MAFPGGNLVLPSGTKLVPGRLLVRFRAGSAPLARAEARAAVDADVVTAYHLVPRLQLLRVPEGDSAVAAAAALQQDPAVEYAAPDIERPLATAPNDTRYGEQWGPPAIGAPAAWGRVTGSSTVKVAVLDTGMKLDHPDLAGNLFTNSGEIAGNNMDDDGNGFVDDVHGWDFFNSDNDASDGYGHGTHVSGIIGAVGNNNLGIAGLNWSVRLLPLKTCNDSGSCSISAEIAALQYAVDMGAKVANSSFGSARSPVQAEADAISAAGAAGLLDVAAAGNVSYDNDALPFYPASYALSNLISVAATAADQSLAYFSNYGATSVHIGAPGDGIRPSTVVPSPGRETT